LFLKRNKSSLPTPFRSSTPKFIDPKKGSQHYLRRYYNEPAYKLWFDKNYPDYTIEEAIELAIPDSISKLKEIKSLFHKKSIHVTVIVLAITVFGLVVFNTAWFADDAYIMFRTIDNVSNGYGLVWNTHERVQTFTAAAMTLLQTVFYLITRDIYYTNIFLSVGISLVTVILFSFKIAKTTTLALLGITIFIMSKAFVDYSTSGLENPLTHLILALFFIVYVKSCKKFTTKNFFLLTLIAGFGAFNRTDTLILFLPAVLFVFYKIRSLKSFGLLIAGLTPIISWEIFSVLYYGFLFPNSAYSKVINSGQTNQIERGLNYFVDSLTWDPLTLSIIGAGVLAIFLTKRWQYLPFVVSIFLYFGWIFRMGADFMSGRFFTATLIIAVFLLVSSLYGTKFFSRKWVPPIIFATIIIFGITSPNPPIFSDSNFGGLIHGENIHNGITDERGFYYSSSGLFRSNTDTPHIINNYYSVENGRTKVDLSSYDIALCSNIGFFGWYAGPNIVVLEPWAKGDGFLSHIPAEPGDRMTGHYRRGIPAGYLESIVFEKNLFEDENLAQYYDKLMILQRSDDFFSLERLKIIWNMNTGKYNHLIESYDASNDDFVRHGLNNPNVKVVRCN